MLSYHFPTLRNWRKNNISILINIMVEGEGI
jgi:hypothetical protein